MRYRTCFHKTYFDEYSHIVCVDMAQDVFQVLGMWNDIVNEELQGLRQEALLCCVSHTLLYCAHRLQCFGLQN